MKLARKISQNPMFILFLISSFLFASCSNNNDDVLTSNDNKLSGEEMFKQIFFMQGGENNLLKNNPTYAIHLEKLQKLNSKEKEESYKFTSELIGLMKKESPNYFNEFEIAINLLSFFFFEILLKVFLSVSNLFPISSYSMLSHFFL